MLCGGSWRGEQGGQQVVGREGGQPIHLLAVGGWPSTERLSCSMYCFKFLPFIY